MPQTAEIIRRLDNLIRFGTIAEVDLANAKVKVQSGEIITTWLPWLTQRAGTTQSWSAPTVGEQCLILAVSGELTTALVLAGIYTQNAPSQNGDEHLITFPDGATVSYNHTSGHLSAKHCKTAEIQAGGTITLDCPTVICTGDLQVQKAVSATGNISSQGSVSAANDVSGGGISLKTHTHTGVERGGKKTDTPS